MTGRYEKISSDELPRGVRLSTPAHEQGQMITWAYGSPGQRSEGGHGDAFASRTEGGVTTYYRWVAK